MATTLTASSAITGGGEKGRPAGATAPPIPPKKKLLSIFHTTWTSMYVWRHRKCMCLILESCIWRLLNMYNEFFRLMFIVFVQFTLFLFFGSATGHHLPSQRRLLPPNLQTRPSRHPLFLRPIFRLYAMSFFFSQLDVDEIEFFMQVCGVVTYLLCMYCLECIRI